LPDSQRNCAQDGAREAPGQEGGALACWAGLKSEV
jgi:hypothetical protein